MSDATENTITLARTIDAPVEEIFAAWTDPALLEQWQADHVEFEPFEGGSFRLETEDDAQPGRSLVVTGTVVSFEEDHKLVELWHPEGGAPDEDSTLIVTFESLGAARTRLSLVEIAAAHADPQSRIFAMEAWDAALGELADLLE
ncbi:SRPBCC family protein [Pelagibacterium lacus]|uniref:SRPBCC domain-containing protein n=1 Tax=Pelagibacterium lacus TaxID=2282655 RepID=A0A369W5P9_9HYPH|nr:SRPBCC domain-containing protein [Pelagibacterium lacus]RDE09185.1 SRPBCC domain-containing protein [Pelagibacterium lacus]